MHDGKVKRLTWLGGYNFWGRAAHVGLRGVEESLHGVCGTDVPPDGMRQSKAWIQRKQHENGVCLQTTTELGTRVAIAVWQLGMSEVGIRSITVPSISLQTPFEQLRYSLKPFSL